MPMSPYVSFVLVAGPIRDDRDLFHRLQCSVNGMAALWQKHRVDAELILIDGEPASDRPGLRDALVWPVDLPAERIRVIDLPSPPPHQPAVHRTARDAAARNAGIRQAAGTYVLTASPGLLFSEPFMMFIGRKALDPACVYRINRHDVNGDVPLSLSIESQLQWCADRAFRVATAHGTVPMAVAASLAGLPPPDRPIPDSADGLLMTRSNWEAVGGFPEPPDGAAADEDPWTRAAARGLRRIILESPMCVYNPVCNASPQTEQAATEGLPSGTQAQPGRTHGKPAPVNDEQRGLPREPFPDPHAMGRTEETPAACNAKGTPLSDRSALRTAEEPCMGSNRDGDRTDRRPSPDRTTNPLDALITTGPEAVKQDCAGAARAYARGDVLDAFSRLERMRRDHPKISRLRYGSACCLVRLGHPVRAIDTLLEEQHSADPHPQTGALLKEIAESLILAGYATRSAVERRTEPAITLVAVPKPFEGHIGIIQRNAIESWKRLHPRPDIVLLGTEVGIPEVCRELGLRHISAIERNEFGTPLVSSIFQIAESCGHADILAYVNADIVLFDDFLEAIAGTVAQADRFLMIGRRWDTDITTPIDFDDPEWEGRVRAFTADSGTLHAPTGIDYFVFRRGLWPRIPPFALGRTVWDNWLVYAALESRAPVVDATEVVTAVHQNHHYNHVAGGKDGTWTGTEAQRNRALAAGLRDIRNISHATVRLYPAPGRPAADHPPSPLISSVEPRGNRRPIEDRRPSPPAGGQRPLKILQVDTFYPRPLELLYAKEPGLAAQPFDRQMERIFKDGFAAIHTLAPYLRDLGHESRWIIGNCAPAQLEWGRRHGVAIRNEKDWMYEIVRAQIAAFAPDVLYTTDAMVFDSRFIRSLAARPPLVIGWQASDIPAGTDWTEFDVILSPLQDLRAAARSVGAKAAEHFLPGFPAWAWEAVKATTPQHDVVFCGQWTQSQHARRNALWTHVARDAARHPVYSCAFYLSGQQEAAPEEVRRHMHPGTYGLDMFRALRTGRIGLDARAAHRFFGQGSARDIGGRETANMRIFETTGCGVFLLTEQYDNLRDCFELGKEIETFRDQAELTDKIRYYLAHPEEREAIARRGQQRCLRDHSMERRIHDFTAVIGTYLPRAAGSRADEAIRVESETWTPLDATGDFSDLKQRALRSRFGRWKVRLGSLTIYCHDLLSFYMSAKDIFLRRIYEFESETDAPLVIDGGGFIGLFTLFVKNKYPRARIRVFEPDREALSLLTKNLEANGIRDVDIVTAGLYKEDGEVGFASDHSDGSSMFSDQKTATIRVCRLSPYLTEHVDFLKLNIEGAEHDVIADVEPKLDLIKHLAIEYHGFPELPQTLHPILERLDRHGFRYFIHDFDEETNPTTKPPAPIRPDSRFWLLVTAKRLRSAQRGAETPRPGSPAEETASAWRTTPISRTFGFDRGKPIDRHYIETFLGKHRDGITGRVLEIGDNAYTRQFGRDVARSDVLSVEPGPGVTIVGDLVSGTAIPKASFDCIIMPQTAQMLLDVQAGLRHAVEALKPGGLLLLTASGISQISRHDMDRWGEYWRFTDKSLRLLLGGLIPAESISVETFGNLAAAQAFLDGRAAHELPRDILDHRDADYQVLLAAAARKPVPAPIPPRDLGRTASRNGAAPPPCALLYHRVWGDPVDAHLLAVSVEHFESHIKHLARSSRVIPLRQLIEEAAAGPVTPGTVALTFDDGYADVLINAVPLLEQYGVHATVFVSSGLVGGEKAFWWDTLEHLLLGAHVLPPSLTVDTGAGSRSFSMAEPAARLEAHDVLWGMLQQRSAEEIQRVLTRLAQWTGRGTGIRPTHRAVTEEELRTLAASPAIEIGAHTVTHQTLSAVPADVQQQEITESKRQLEAWLNRPVPLFSYPFGGPRDFTADTARLVAQAGFTAGIANIPGDIPSPIDRFAVPRRLVRNWPGTAFAAWLGAADKTGYERAALQQRRERLTGMTEPVGV